jgi:hypothetical protein
MTDPYSSPGPNGGKPADPVQSEAPAPRQARQALSRLSTTPARDRLSVQEDSWAGPLLRAVGRPRRRSGKVPGTEGCPRRYGQRLPRADQRRAAAGRR